MKISLKDMHFHAYHGVMEEEWLQGNNFLVSVTMELPEVRGCQTDRLEDTIDYSQVAAIVQREMAIPSQLLEHVAQRIHTALQTSYPIPEMHISVTVSKHHPPMGVDCEWASVQV